MIYPKTILEVKNSYLQWLNRAYFCTCSISGLLSDSICQDTLLDKILISIIIFGKLRPSYHELLTID